jgi:MFS family permease
MLASEHLLLKINRGDGRKTQRVLSLISTLGTVQSLLTAPLSGRLVDGFGRARILVCSCLASAVARALPLLSPTTPAYVAYRLLNSAAFQTLAMALSSAFADRLGGRSSENYHDCMQKLSLCMALARMLTLRAVSSRLVDPARNFVLGAALPAVAGALFALAMPGRAQNDPQRLESSESAMAKSPAAGVVPRLDGWGPLGFVNFFTRSPQLKAVAALLMLQWAPMYNGSALVYRQKQFGWTMKDSEKMLQISNLCGIVSPMVYPAVASKLYGLSMLEGASCRGGDGGHGSLEPASARKRWRARRRALKRATAWSFRISSALSLGSALSPTKWSFFFHPIVRMVAVASGPDRVLALLVESMGSPASPGITTPGAERRGTGAARTHYGEMMAAVTNLSVPLGLTLPAFFAASYGYGCALEARTRAPRRSGIREPLVRVGRNINFLLCAALNLVAAEIIVPWAWRIFDRWDSPLVSSEAGGGTEPLLDHGIDPDPTSSGGNEEKRVGSARASEYSRASREARPAVQQKHTGVT